jgi:hypothetical protein
MRQTWWIGLGFVMVVNVACGGGSHGNATGAGGSSATGTGGSSATGTGGGGGSGGGGTGGTGTVGAPGPFGLVAPIPDSSAQSVTPTLSWEAAAGATTYAVEIATSRTFGTSDVYQQVVNAGTTSVTVPAAMLEAGVVYFWRVSAQHGADYTVATGAPQWFSSPYHVPGAHGLAATPDGSEVLVASGINNGPVDVIDLATHTVWPIETGVASQPVGVAISPNGHQALVTLVTNGVNGVNGVAVIDLVQGSMAGGIYDPCVATTLTDVAYFPNGGAAMPDLSSGCAAMGLSTFTPDLNNPQFAFTNLHDTNDPFGVAISPAGTFALVTMELDSKLYRIDFGASVSSISLSASSAGVAITPDGSTAVVAEATLDLVDVATGVVTPVALSQDTPGSDFHNVAITPDGQVAAVVGTGSIQFVSIATRTVLAAYPADNASNVALSPDGSLAYVSDRANGWVRVVPVP